MPRVFDAYVIVDWSAANKPVTGPNSIWIGMLAKDARLKLHFKAVNVDTRLKARAFLEDFIGKLTGRGDRVLLGFDFSLGYPAGTAGALGLDVTRLAPWAATHTFLAQKIKEKADNSNARYAIAAGMNYSISKGPFPFWGAPTRDLVSTLGATKPDFTGAALDEFRRAEKHLRDRKLGAPKSCWQLTYTGSVGSQSLTGIPHVHALRQAWPKARLWPFETGLKTLTDETLDGVNVVIAEVYPSLLAVTAAAPEILDEAQVRTTAQHFAAQDEKGKLAAMFGPAVSDADRAIIEAEEGWILGA
jgi:hypothetical protein